MVGFSLSSWRLKTTLDRSEPPSTLAARNGPSRLGWIVLRHPRASSGRCTPPATSASGARSSSSAPPLIWGEHDARPRTLVLLDPRLRRHRIGPAWFTEDGLSRKYARRRFQESLAGRAVLVIVGLLVLGSLPNLRNLLAHVPMLEALAGADGRGPLSALIYLVALGSALFGYYRANLQGKLGLGSSFLIVAGSAFLSSARLLLELRGRRRPAQRSSAAASGQLRRRPYRRRADHRPRPRLLRQHQRRRPRPLLPRPADGGLHARRRAASPATRSAPAPSPTASGSPTSSRATAVTPGTAPADRTRRPLSADQRQRDDPRLRRRASPAGAAATASSSRRPVRLDRDRLEADRRGRSTAACRSPPRWRPPAPPPTRAAASPAPARRPTRSSPLAMSLLSIRLGYWLRWRPGARPARMAEPLRQPLRPRREPTSSASPAPSSS